MKIKDANDAFCAIKDIIQRDDQEEVYAILLNRANSIIRIQFEALGSESAAIIPHKVICRDAVCSLASGVILVHTHPSGNTSPSLNDIKETERLKNMLEICDVQLLDHIIVSGDRKSYYAFSEEGKGA